MNGLEKGVLERFRARVAERLSIHQIILFGSRARGDADPDSDMDVLVVLAEEPDEDARDWVSECAWEAGLPHGIVVVPIVFGRRQWEQGPERHSLLAQAVRAEGVAL